MKASYILVCSWARMGEVGVPKKSWVYGCYVFVSFSFCVFILALSYIIIVIFLSYNIICAKGETKLFVNREYVYIYKQTSVSLFHQEASIRRRKWQPTLIFLLEKSHGQRSLLGYSLWGHKRIGHDWVSKQQTMHQLELPYLGKTFWIKSFSIRGQTITEN